MKKERVSGSKKTKTETISKLKNLFDLGGELPIFSAISSVDVQNLNLSITRNIRDLLISLIQQSGVRDFLNLHTKCMDPKQNLNDLSDIVCDKYLAAENEILKVKLEEVDKEYTYLRSEVKSK